MSERDPAIGLLEFESIAVGIDAGDAMVKAAPVGSIYAGTVHPGKYLVLVSGDTASVEIALDVARDGALGELFLPDVHPAVPDAMVAGNAAATGDESLGVIETTTVSAAVVAADAGMKAAMVDLAAIRLADGLGGKGYVLFAGTVAEVEAALEAATGRLDAAVVVATALIPQLHPEMAANLDADLRFSRRIARREKER